MSDRTPDSPIETTTDTDRETGTTRRTTLRGLGMLGAGVAGISMTGSAAAAPDDTQNDTDTSDSERVDPDEYDDVVDLDVSDGDDITDEIEDAASDGTLIRVPSGTFTLSGTIRITGLSHLGLVGNDTTLDIASTDDYVLKLGIYDNPITDLHVEGFTADISSDNTGGRIFELNGGDSLGAYDLTVTGQHDTTGGKGPMLVGLANEDGEGTVENIDLSDGGLRSFHDGSGGTGMLISNAHNGTVTIRNAVIGPFPDNGIYGSNEDGTMHVEDSEIRNANVAGVRLSGDDSSISNTSFVYDENVEAWDGQRPIRVDRGENVTIEDSTINLSLDITEAIRIQDTVESITISNVTFDLSGGVRDAIAVTGDTEVNTNNLSVSGDIRSTVFRY